MFGYLDERLAQDEKYLPFPLGPAISRGWKPLLPLLQTGERPLLASYRGSKVTHYKESKQIENAMRSLREAGHGIVLEERRKWRPQDTAMDSARYHELMRTSRFALSPGGNNPNTYRILEAVESGSIPIFVSDARGCYRNWAALYGYEAPGATRYPW